MTIEQIKKIASNDEAIECLSFLFTELEQLKSQVAELTMALESKKKKRQFTIFDESEESK